MHSQIDLSAVEVYFDKLKSPFMTLLENEVQLLG
jgi:hypothetical protein